MPTQEEWIRRQEEEARAQVEPEVPEVQPIVEVVNQSQQVKVAAFTPESKYSRIITIAHNIPSPPGQDFAITPILGDVFRLLAVDVWMSGQGLPVATQWWFDLRVGHSRPTTTLQIQQWEYLMTVYNPLAIGMFGGFGNPVERSWEMNKIYSGATQRIAIIANMVGPAQSRVTASFRISEG